MSKRNFKPTLDTKYTIRLKV